jgi:hypothetical protein
MIDYSGLAGGKPKIDYDTSELEKGEHKIHFALDPQNPVYQQVIDECNNQNLSYKIKEGESKQKHIWIKGWKKV